MYGVRVSSIVTNRTADDLIAAYKKRSVFPFGGSLTNECMMFYMYGRTGLMRSAPRFKVVIKIKPISSDQNELTIYIKPTFMFYCMHGIAALVLLYLIWAFTVKGMSFAFFLVPFFIVFVAIMENKWQQEICMETLERIGRSKEA